MSRSDAMTLVRAFVELAARFRRDTEAVAVVEFALVLPFLLFLYLGSMEASSLYTVDRRVEVISGTVADLTARWNPNEAAAMPSATLRDYFRAALGIMIPYSTTGMKQVVSVLKITPAGVVTVEWSCSWPSGAARSANTAYPLPADRKMNILARNATANAYLVAAEVSYPYKPVLGLVFTEAINLQSENLFLPRFGVKVAAPNGGCPS